MKWMNEWNHIFYRIAMCILHPSTCTKYIKLKKDLNSTYIAYSYLPNSVQFWVPNSVHFTFFTFPEQMSLFMCHSVICFRKFMVGVCVIFLTVGSLLETLKYWRQNLKHSIHHFLLKAKPTQQTEAKILNKDIRIRFQSFGFCSFTFHSIK